MAMVRYPLPITPAMLAPANTLMDRPEIHFGHRLERRHAR